MKKKGYISDITEEEKLSRPMGDVQILTAGEKEKIESYENCGNQKPEYYKK